MLSKPEEVIERRRIRLIFVVCILTIMCFSKPDANNHAEGQRNSTTARRDSLKLWKSFEKLQAQRDLKPGQITIIISVIEQSLYLIKGKEIVRTYPVSTSKYGTGSREGSNKTPLGTHRISRKIGEGAKIGTVFKAGINTGKIAEIYTDTTDTQEDIITTRIMRLEGLETGINRGRGIDSYKRRIYIHGTPEEGLIGKPASHGCIRMKNGDVIELFGLVPKGTLVEIQR